MALAFIISQLFDIFDIMDRSPCLSRVVNTSCTLSFTCTRGAVGFFCMGAKILLQGEANVMTRSIRLEVPIIDVAPLVAGTGDQEEAAAAMGQACRENGFFM